MQHNSRSSFRALFYWLLTLVCTAALTAASIDSQPQALLEIRDGFSNGAAVLSDWNVSTDANYCIWMGVQCTPAGDIAALNLTGLGLQGTVPSAGWAQLVSLQSLSLEANSLLGTIPWTFPAGLKKLVLSSNALSGSLPEYLPENLLNLQAANNRLRGPLPAQLPPGMQALFLFNNSIGGTIPGSWACMPSMRVWSLHDNALTNHFPIDLPPQLEELALGGNRIWGSIFDTDWRLPRSLRKLLLQGNLLTGTVPCCVDFPANLTDLFLGDNPINGTLPGASWELPESLNRLYLGNTQLWGSIPPDIVWPSNLTELDMSNNRQLTGSLPSGWDLPPTLQVLRLSGCNLTGTIPTDLGANTSLRELYLDQNKYLGGPISPAWVDTLPESLRVLNVYLNDLTGTLPANWHLPRLITMQLANSCIPAGNCPGSLPAWPAPTGAQVVILPQVKLGDNAGPCGEVPSTPPYYEYNVMTGLFNPSAPLTRLNASSLPSCPGSSPAPSLTSAEQGTGPFSSGGNTAPIGAIVGGVVGGALILVACATVWWRVRRRHRRIDQHASQAHPGSGGDKATLPRGPPSFVVQPDGVSMGSSSTVQSGHVLRIAVEAARSNGGSSSLGSLEHLKMWVIDFSSLQLIRPIGEGSYGRVYLGLWRECPVAVNLLLSAGLDAANEGDAMQQAITLSHPVLANLQKEAALMSSMRHANIVQFFGFCTAPPCVVTEFCSKGSLTEVLRAARRTSSIAAKLDWPRRLSMMLDCAKGMLYLHCHSPPIIHRDLKSPNLLVTSDWHVRVSDFNLSKILESTAVLSSAQATNPRWLPPEVLKAQPATQHSDVYSFGVIMWELLTWELPYARQTHWEVINDITSGRRLPVPAPDELPGRGGGAFEGLPTYNDLMRRCWAADPEERPSFQEIVQVLKSLLALAMKRQGWQQRGLKPSGAANSVHVDTTRPPESVEERQPSAPS